VDAVQFLLPSIQGLNDKLERATVANDLASYLGVESGLVLEYFRKVAADRVDRTAAPKSAPAKATDRILLPLLVGDAAARSQLIGGLRDLPALRHLPTAPIYDVLIGMEENGEPIDFHSIHSRLPEALQARFAAIVLDAPLAALEDGLACLDALRRDERDAVRRELKTRIRDAERAGQIAAALDLMHELSRLA
jgi:hypothetical protein